MNQSHPWDDLPGADWCWPIQLERYDRSPDLSSEEWETICAWHERAKNGGVAWRPNMEQKLARLLLPLRDIEQVMIECNHQRFYRPINSLLLGMYEQRTAFWAWGLSEWRACFVRHSGEKSYGHVELLAIVYLLAEYRNLYVFGRMHHVLLAKRLFGDPMVRGVTNLIQTQLRQWGYQADDDERMVGVVSVFMLVHRSPRPDEWTVEMLDQIHHEMMPVVFSHYVVRVSKVLVEWGILSHPLDPIAKTDDRPNTTTIEGVPSEWLHWAQRWLKHSTLTPKSRQGYYYSLLRVGRWLAHYHPDIVSPEAWTRDLAIEYVASVQQQKVGDWVSSNHRLGGQLGKPLAISSQQHHLLALRAFFTDCQDWGWIPDRFDPRRFFNLPRRQRAQIGPNPRIIADDVWAKLLWAGLNLTPEDLSGRVWFAGDPDTERLAPQFPFEMIRALTLVWLFAGLRSNEIRRLRVGCIRWQPRLNGSDLDEPICLLDVPVNKTGSAFTKPVSHLVGKAIEDWERVRPEQPRLLDVKTNEMVHFLFYHRRRWIGSDHVNQVIIPMLCRKAGIPPEDVRGPLTSHRARSTIASQLANAREPMSLLELMQWLGHSSPKATQHYVKITPTRLAKSYADAGYFDRNMRMIQVLLDQDAIRSGDAQEGVPWKFYDLGHGYCSYDFFDQCPHRMACAKCTFYIPKASSQAQLLEAKTNLQRLLQEIPLTEDEQAAVEDGVDAVTTLLTRLVDVPTPAGPTPRQLEQQQRATPPGFVALDDIQ